MSTDDAANGTDSKDVLRPSRNLVGVLLVCITFNGCESPEAARTRGGGPGGDGGNRPANVKMHEGSQQYWETPVVIPGESVSLEPARHAQQLSLP